MTNKQNMLNEIRAIGEPLYAKPLKDISFAQVLADLLKIARRYRMIVQPQLILLQKTIFNVEALARRLDPNLNLWEHAKPYVENWIQQRFSITKSLSTLAQRTPELLHHLCHTPLRPQAQTPIPTPEPSQNQPAKQAQLYLLLGLLSGIVLTRLLPILGRALF
jgi:predicted unusual protein kinase regulating ubiquinone biosynthesis (AarF/ABC1/UbiB family)